MPKQESNIIVIKGGISPTSPERAYMIIGQSEHEHVRHNVVHGKMTLPNWKGKQMSVTFTKDKETKNTIRFTSPIGSTVSGSIYVPKDSDLAKKTEIVLEVSEKVEVSAWQCR